MSPSRCRSAVSDLAGGPTPGSAVNPNALYALPVFSLFPYVLSGVALGNAQACLDDYVEFARHRVSTYNRAKIGDMQSTQIKIAEASAKIDAARLIDAHELHRGDDRRQAQPHSPYRRPRPGCGATAPFRSISAPKRCRCCSRRAARAACSLSGALQRQFRDAHAINSHLAFNFDAAGTNYGRVALGLPSENLTL